MSKASARPAARPRKGHCRLCKVKLRPHEKPEELCDACLRAAQTLPAVRA